MKRRENVFNESSRINREAADWLAKRVRGLSSAEQDAFFDWLARDPRHGEFYAKHGRVWKNLDMLAQWLPEHSDRPNMDLLKSRKQQRSWSWILGLAAALVLGVLSFFGLGRTGLLELPPKNLVANSYESHALPDGSIAELNQGAALSLDFSKRYRRVELVSSEAHFRVAKDPDRPFIVSVRGIEVHAIGTAFNVRLQEDSVRVVVTEGRVQLREALEDAEKAAAPLASSSKNIVKQDLVVGQMTEVPLGRRVGPFEVEEVSRSELDLMLAWKPRMFEFNSAPLSEVIKEFNRKSETDIVIGDDSLKTVSIVASFSSANPDHFVELLQLSISLRAERPEERRIILYASD